MLMDFVFLDDVAIYLLLVPNYSNQLFRIKLTFGYYLL